MRKQVYCLLLAFLFISPAILYCQNFSYANVVVKSVSFSNGNLNIRKDDGSGSYTAPQWQSSVSIQSPVAYTSGNAPTVAATFSITCTDVPAYVYIRGMGPNAINFPQAKVTVASSSTTSHGLQYPATAASSIFTKDQVQFFKPFTILWEISFDDGATWKSIGSTSNTLYVTRSAPQAESGNYKWYHTVFDLSCRNAKGKTTDADVISSVWSEFTDQVVLNFNNDSLFYYKDMSNPYVTLGSLLKYRDAECYTFAQLFLASIKIQGVIRTNNYVYITPRGDMACGYEINRFLVKDWSFGTPTGSSDCADFPYKNTYSTLIPAPYTSYSFITADVKDQKGIPGSCTKNPSSFFNNHQIAKIDGVYYDACYGVTFQSLSEIKTKAFSGWGYRLSNGGTNSAYFTNDMNKTELDETIETF